MPSVRTDSAAAFSNITHILVLFGNDMIQKVIRHLWVKLHILLSIWNMVNLTLQTGKGTHTGAMWEVLHHKVLWW